MSLVSVMWPHTARYCTIFVWFRSEGSPISLCACEMHGTDCQCAYTQKAGWGCPLYHKTLTHRATSTTRWGVGCASRTSARRMSFNVDTANPSGSSALRHGRGM